MTVSITFLGAAGTVTGSKYLVESGDRKILVDCGMFQGERRWREENWRDPPFDPGAIDAVLITHAHIDHIGMLPRYCALGLRAPIFASKGTVELCGLLLPDSAHLQEEEARYRAERGRSRHRPPLPLYTVAEAKQSLTQLREVAVAREIEVLPGVRAEWRRMGHILGACSIRLSIGGSVITFSGDIGRYSVPILRDPVPVEFGDLLLIESTYGDRTHPKEDPTQTLRDVVRRTAARGGVVVIPSFAVGRAQLLLYYLRELKERREIPDLPVIVDSPMAEEATSLYHGNPADYDEGALQVQRAGRNPFRPSKMGFAKDRNDSIRLNGIDEPMIVISASGMLSGGRILHHLKHRISDPRNTVLFVGHQPEGGRGDWILKGASTVRLFGDEIPIRAEIDEISGLSAHGDREEMLRWCRESTGKPGRVAVVHGELPVAKEFQRTLEREFGWYVTVPAYRDRITL